MNEKTPEALVSRCSACRRLAVTLAGAVTFAQAPAAANVGAGRGTQAGRAEATEGTTKIVVTGSRIVAKSHQAPDAGHGR